MYKKNVQYDWQRGSAFRSGELLDKDNVISSIESSHKSDPESARTTVRSHCFNAESPLSASGFLCNPHI